MKKTEANNTTSLYTEDWLPINGFQNGLIKIKEKNLVGANMVVTGVRVEPRNIFIADDMEQNRVINELRNFYNTMDFEFWLICCDRPVDINLYKSELEILYNNCPTPQGRKLILEDMDKCDKFIGPEINAVDTEFYLLFKDSEKEMDRIQKRIHNMIAGLAAAGLNSRQISDEDARVILDSFFNDSQKIEFGTVMTDV